MARNKITYGKVSISNVRTAITDYKKKYYLAMKRLMKDAAAVFVKTAVAHVHVDTGMSAASLHPFGKKVGAPVLGSIIPKRAYRKGQTALSGRYYPKRWRSISEGEKAGKTAYEINVGSFERPYMSFRFQIKVWQYWYWEANWQSLNEASVDAEIFIDNNYEKYLPEGLDKVFKYGSPNVNY
jgi:hypothetical protein